MIIMFPVIAIKTMSEVADGHSPADSPLVYLGDNWYKINDYLAAKVLLQVKGSSPTAVPFETWAQGQIHDGIFAIPGGQRLGGQGLAVIAVAFSLKILQPFVGSVVIPPMALARLFECYNIPAGDSCTTTGTPVLVYYLSGTINSLGFMFRQCREKTIEVDLGDVFAANFRVVGISLLGPEGRTCNSSQV
ncbi:fimbrial-like adhesin protein [Escherichia coli]|uniref:Fimbrial-like adhesin protein n=1 Tax=Escherichia coli TaxID=562 RepID=A0A376RLJ1_ECOLX|nr:fimbrial-like adhesin protein [Escherichia coli]